MKVAIISDVHNNTVNLKKVLDFCVDKQINKIICCGDLASQETLDFFCDNFSGEILHTFGNMEAGQFDIKVLKQKTNGFSKYKNAKVYEDFGELEIEDNPVKPGDHGARKIAFIHFPREAKELAESGKYDFVFYGHTHKPWVASVETTADRGPKNKCIMLNPGNVANEIYPPTFAVWNTEDDKFDLVKVNELK